MPCSESRWYTSSSSIVHSAGGDRTSAKYEKRARRSANKVTTLRSRGPALRSLCVGTYCPSEGHEREGAWDGESIFTLVKALGGIATGIGAIWTALVARRQALLTEQALLEQRRSLKEQEERARLSFEMDMLFRLADRFESPAFLQARRAAAGYVKERFFTDDGGLLEVEYLDQTLARLLNFFEELGQFVRAEGLRAESVWTRFG